MENGSIPLNEMNGSIPNCHDGHYFSKSVKKNKELINAPAKSGKLRSWNKQCPIVWIECYFRMIWNICKISSKRWLNKWNLLWNMLISISRYVSRFQYKMTDLFIFLNNWTNRWIRMLFDSFWWLVKMTGSRSFDSCSSTFEFYPQMSIFSIHFWY